MNPRIFDLLSRGLFGQFLAGSAKVFKGYSQQMVEIRKTETFAKWIDGLSDIRARARILVRVERLSSGNPGENYRSNYGKNKNYPV